MKKERIEQLIRRLISEAKSHRECEVTDAGKSYYQGQEDMADKIIIHIIRTMPDSQ